MVHHYSPRLVHAVTRRRFQLVYGQKTPTKNAQLVSARAEVRMHRTIYLGASDSLSRLEQGGDPSPDGWCQDRFPQSRKPSLLQFPLCVWAKTNGDELVMFYERWFLVCYCLVGLDVEIYSILLLSARVKEPLWDHERKKERKKETKHSRSIHTRPL